MTPEGLGGVPALLRGDVVQSRITCQQPLSRTPVSAPMSISPSLGFSAWSIRHHGTGEAGRRPQ